VDLDTGRVKLTDLASCGGCAAKYSAARLEQLLAGFVPAEAENLLVGLAPADDAAVYRLDDERALIFTLDFFPPVVDDPGDYGAIAATNALNDVFAMGGTPLLALSIAAFPEELPMEMLAEIFAAADAQVRAAGGLLAGGHTIRDEEPKYGLAVIGTVHPNAIWRKNGARPGDALFLTKPLGTGLIMSGYKRGDAGTQQLERAVRWMRTLNNEAADVLRRLEPHAVTGSSATRTRWRIAAARGCGSSRSASRRSTERSTSRVTACARAAIHATATSRARTLSSTASRTPWSRSASTPRPRAGCSSRSRATAPRRWRPSSRRESSSSAGSAASRRAPESS
jgi:selenium donor protein